MCQCPQTGNTHFYDYRSRLSLQQKLVSMPSNGQHSFLHEYNKFIGDIYSVCQCPQTGNTHFYEFEELLWISTLHVSMPSNGQHSFLQETVWKKFLLVKRVNALKRATLISTVKRRKCKWKWALCQCPQTGNTHFYQQTVNSWIYPSNCVNALQRTTLISTVPPQKPLLYKASRTPFLRVIHRIFWKRRFFRDLLVCSQFVHF